LSSQSPYGPRKFRGRQLLTASGLAAALVVVPGLARADEPLAPAGDPGAPVSEAVDEVTDAIGGGDTGDPVETPAAGEEGAAPAPGAAPEPPPELDAALRELAAALQLPEDCVNGISQSVDLLIAGLLEVPAELEALVAELRAALEELPAQGPDGLAGLPGQLREILEGAADPTVVEDSSIVAGLELLAETLPACAPTLPGAPPTDTPEPPAPPAAAPPVAPAEQPVTQAVVYPGYAPTGAEDDDVPAAVPAGALALLLGAGAGAAAYRRQWRAASPTD
jgi:hypothetical protein